MTIPLPIILVACQTPIESSRIAQPLPNHLFEKQGCAVLAGGSIGASFNDQSLTNMYFDANRKVTGTIYDHLTAENYKVSILTVQPPSASSAPDMMLQELSRKKCSRLIQVSTIAGEDKFGKFFGFKVEVLRIEPKSSIPTPGDRSAVVAGEYKKVYRYERNEENYQNLSLSGIGQQAYRELKESLVLESIK